MNMNKNTRTEAQAIEWVYDQDETQEVDRDQLEAAFAALYGRPADDEDRQNGLWSLCCNMTPNCGTRPEGLTTQAISRKLGVSEEYVSRKRAQLAPATLRPPRTKRELLHGQVYCECMKINLFDSFNDVKISSHNTLLAAVRKSRAHDAAVKRSNGSNSYVTYAFRYADGSSVDWADLMESRSVLDEEQWQTTSHLKRK